MAFSQAIIRLALDEDAVQIVVNGTSYHGWQSIDIDSDILVDADAFQISGYPPDVRSTPVEARAGTPDRGLDDFREGQMCDVYVGLDRQMSGVIDEVEISGSRMSLTMRISGRDKAAFLADSEAKAIKASKYTIKTLIEALLDKAWGIRSVILSNEDNRKLMLGKKDKKKPTSALPKWLSPLPRDRTKIDPGQTIANILEQRTRQLGLTWWLTAQGDLFIGKPNYEQQAAYHFTSGELKSDTSTNVISWRVLRSVSERYSEIRVVGQGWASPKKLWETSAIANPLVLTSTGHATKFLGVARDPDLVERGIIRKLIISDSDVLSSDEAQKRADWEMGKRRLRGLVINLTVPDFRQGDRLFTTDTLATVKIEEAGIDGPFYVTQRRFTEDRGRRQTQLTLHEIKVWLP